MAQVALANNKPLQLDGTTGHGQGQGSGSGAGIWLSGAASTAGVEAGNKVSAGRSYHISADASRPTSQATNDIFLTMNPSDSGDVDLDLSFDFVSQMETARHSTETPQQNSPTKIVVADSTDASSPRGMSTAKWTARLRKQPPSALRLPNKKQLTVTTSHFSPISPLDHKVAGEAPLLVIPLSSTRRAIDSDVNISRAELVQKQRLAAQIQNKEQPHHLSPQKISPVKQAASGLLRKRTVLGEIKNKSNVQQVPSVEHGDVFDDASYNYKKDLNPSASQVSTFAGNKSASFATALESHGEKTRKGRQPPDSMESMNTYGSALSGASSAMEVPTIELPSSNILGLNLTGAAKSREAAPVSANDTILSSPDTPSSPLFSSTKSQSDGINTPSTAFSTLFDDLMSSSGDSKAESSSQMKRGLSAPLPNTTPIVNDVIQEEESSTSRQVHTAPGASFLVDLPLMQDGLEDLKERYTAIASVSDFGSSPFKGNRTMIVNTADSPTNEADFLFRKPSQIKMVEELRRTSGGAKADPWPQSPLLLNSYSQGDVSDELQSGLGLGIDMGGKADHMQVDMSELSVERVILPEMEANTLGLDLGLQSMHDPHFVPSKMDASLAPFNTKQGLPASPSYVSSVEGFAINVTPADKEVVQVPAISTEGDDGQTRSRWSSKLWSLSPLSSLRSPRSPSNANRTPQMKTLTLTSKRKDAGDYDWQARGPTADDGYNSVPSSTIVPYSATFVPLQAPSHALSSRARSSRHVSRSSRLRYVPNEDGHVQVDMTSPEVNQAPIKMPNSPSCVTPKMEYMISAKSRRHSWGYASTSGHTEAPSWLPPKHLEVPAFGGLRNSTLSTMEPIEAEVHPYRPMDTVVEDGIRRRANHRATNSVPSTPVVIPASWASPELYEEAYGGYVDDGQGVQFDNGTNEVYHRQEQRRRTGAINSTIGIYGPASAVGPYLLGLSGTRNRSKMVKTTGQHTSASYSTRRHTQLQLFSDEGEYSEGLFAISGRALETSPSKSLFFAGFLAMPWLWFIGGWGLENDGTVYVDGDAIQGLHSAQQQSEQELVEPVAMHVSGRESHFLNDASMLSARGEPNARYSMGTPESIINMEEEYQDFQRRGKARSFVESSSRLHVDDQTLRPESARRAHSLLEGEQRNSIRPLSRQELLDMANTISIPVDMQEEQPRLHSIDIQDNQQDAFAYSSQNEKDRFSNDEHGITLPGAFALPISGWDDYEDHQSQNKKAKKIAKNPTFFEQVMGANATMLRRLKTSASTTSSFSLANVEQRRKAAARLQSHTSPDHQPVLIRAFTDWTRLETFVLWNRIMSLVISIAVFGAAGVAIFFVISDW